MEAAGNRDCARSADVSLKVGLAGAVAAALAGLTDWQATDGPARRVGVTHGILNLTAASLYAISLVERNRKNRGAGRALAFCGFAISSISAWLGGNLVYGKQIGVNHTAGEPMPTDWTDVGSESDLIEDRPLRVMADGIKVLLVKRAGRIYGIAEVCSHLGGPLAEGKLEGDTIECPWHGSRFCVRDGSVVDGPATHPQPRFETRVRNGRIEVRSWSQE
jgi:nitrite reductase/ring-hydroxylating ferredoxin subunit